MPRRAAQEIATPLERAHALSSTAASGPSVRPASVLRVIARLNIGGPARHAVLLADGLGARGFESLLVYGSVERDEGSLEDLLGARQVRSLKITELGRRIRPWSDVRALYELTRLIFRERPDVVHTHTAKAGTLGRLAALAYNATRRRATRCVVVHTFHGHVFSGYFGRTASAAVRVAERRLARATDRVVTISENQRRDITERYRIAPSWKTDVVELGLELAPLLALEVNTHLRERLGFSAGDVVFGYVGRLVPIKDLPTLLRAFQGVVDRVPAARLMIVGDGADRGDLERRAAMLGVASEVRFVGWQRDLAAVYGAMDVAVLSSLNEGTPVALIEAMAAGKPVVATAVGGVEDVVEDGRTGAIVPPGDAEALAAAMTRLARDADARRQMGQAGRLDTAARFLPARLLTGVADLYWQALTERRRLAPSHPWARRAPPRRLRVVSVIARLNVGGPARHAVVLADGLRDRGFESLLVYGSEGPREGSLEDLVRSRRLRGRKIIELGRRIRPWSDIRALAQLTRVIFRERPDVVHTHTAKAGALGRLAALIYNATRRRTRRCLVVHTFHGHVFHGYFGPTASAAVCLAERSLARITDRIVTISESQRYDVSERYRIAPPAKTTVIELGIRLSPLLALETDVRLRRQLGFAADQVVFGYVGRLVAIKDLGTLLRAFAEVAARVPPARLMLVGDGDQRGDLERLTAELGLTSRVRFAGWQRDLAAVYGAMDVCVLSSLNEGTPVALIEAMAAARPVIATAVGGVEDVVTHERTGLVVPPADVAALAAAMIRLAEDPAGRAGLGRQGREEASVRFQPARLGREVDAFYRQMLAEKRGQAVGEASAAGGQAGESDTILGQER